MVADVLKLSWLRLFTGLLAVLVIACPGALWVAAFRPDLLQGLEFSKLLVLSLAISLPSFLMNSVAGILETRSQDRADAKSRDEEAHDRTFAAALALSAFMTVFPLYLPLAYRVIFSPQLSLRVAILLALAIEVLVVLSQTGQLRGDLMREFRSAPGLKRKPFHDRPSEGP